MVEKDSTVLDIGCGKGTLLNYFHKVREIVGKAVDRSEKGVITAIQNRIKARAVDIANEDFTINKKI